MVYASVVKRIREDRNWSQEDLAQEIKKAGLVKTRKAPTPSVQQFEGGKKVSDNIATGINAVLPRNPQESKELQMAYAAFLKSPTSGASHDFGAWLSDAMRGITINNLIEWLEKEHKIKISDAAVTKWRKGLDLVAADKIIPVFDYFQKHPDLGVDIIEGKRTLLKDILKYEPKLEALLEERFQDVVDEWVNKAFPKALKAKR